jgi:acyl-CoA reductase-like NAD-dependent aldehyde dehydrogenase
LRQRLKIFGFLRQQIAAAPRSLALKVGRENIAETLAAEVLPLLDACRFLESEATRILRERRVGNRARPKWLFGTSVVLRREPIGVVLIIAPSNYPLLLPGVQALQAVAAGNSVLIKPAVGCSEVLSKLIQIATLAGLPRDVIQLLPESSEAATLAIEEHVDKVVLTGSATTGQAVSRVLADSTTASVLELSGCDAVFALEDADPELVSDCLLLGLTLNGSRTCMAPRRVFANDALADEILHLLRSKLELRRRDEAGPGRIAGSREARASSYAASKVQEAVAAGAELLAGEIENSDGEAELCGVALLDRVTAEMPVAQADLFAPVVSFIRVHSESQALSENAKCPYRLSATVFGSPKRCQQFARRIDAGCVVINDMIVPTADPRVPFGGQGLSGHGRTRGEAGLLEMTQVKAIVEGRRWFKPHLHAPTPIDADVIELLIRLEHAKSPLHSLKWVPGMIRATLKQMKFRRDRKAATSTREILS